MKYLSAAIWMALMCFVGGAGPLAPAGGFPLAKAISGGTAKVFGSVPLTSLEIRIPQ